MATSREEGPAAEEASSADQTPSILGSSLIFSCLALSVFLISLDSTILSTAIPRITDDFHSLKDVGWYAGVYSLTAAVFQLLYGKFFSIFSIKWTFISGIVIFEIGSVLCAAATSSTMLIVGRACAGIGNAGVFTGALVVVNSTVPLRWRPVVNAAFGSISGISSVVGPVLGGALTDKASWRWCFWINVPAGVVTIGIVMLFFKVAPRSVSEEDSTDQTRSRLTSAITILKQLNLPSMAIITGSVISLLLALQWGGAEYRWDNGRIIALFVVAGTSCSVFVVAQVRQKDRAFVPVHVLKQRTVWSCCWFAFNVGSTASIIAYDLPIWLQAVRGVSALESGVLTLPFVVSLIAGAIVAGGVTSYTGQYAPLMVLSCVTRAVSAGLMSTLSPSSKQWQYILYQVIFGLGDGIGMQQPLIAIQTALKKEDNAMGVAVIVFCQIMGAALFVVVGQSVFSSRFLALLQQRLQPGQIDPERIVDAGATSFRGLGLSSEVLNLVISAYSKAITDTFYIALALACASMVGALTVEWKNVKKDADAGGGAPATTSATTTGVEAQELHDMGNELRPTHSVREPR